MFGSGRSSAPRSRYTLKSSGARKSTLGVGGSSGSTSASSIGSSGGVSTRRAGIQLDRMSQQFRKKYGDKSASELASSVQSEVGWTGLGLIALCLIAVCYIAVWSISAGSDTERIAEIVHGQAHGQHGHSQNDERLNIDPEGWPNAQRRRADDSAKGDDESAKGDARDSQSDNDKEQQNNNPSMDRRERKRREMDELRGRREERRKERQKRREERFNSNNRAQNGEDQSDNEQISANSDNDDVSIHDAAEPDIGSLKERQRRRRRRPEKIVSDEGNNNNNDNNNNDDEFSVDFETRRGNRRSNRSNRKKNSDGSNSNSNWSVIQQYLATIEVKTADERSVDELHNPEFEQRASERAHSVKSAFIHAWHGYAKHAMGHDEIQPVSDIPGDSWGGLGATLMDALDTLMIMGFTDELKEARENLAKVDFNQDLRVSFFETTIRHLGGLLGAFTLSQALSEDGKGDELYLQKAQELGRRLIPAFDTKLGIPKSLVNLRSGEIKNYGWTRDRSVLSEIGSNQLEYYSLAKLTNDRQFYDKSRKVMDLLKNVPRVENGLYSRLIDTETGLLPPNEQMFTIGGMADSFYEYLLKLWVLSEYTDLQALEMYVESIDNINEQLLRMVKSNEQPLKYDFFYGELWYRKYRPRMEELSCFMSGVLALGSYHIERRKKLFDLGHLPRLSAVESLMYDRRKDHLKLAHSFVETCVSMYTLMPTGMAPESIEFNLKPDLQSSLKSMKNKNDDENTNDDNNNNENIYNKNSHPSWTVREPRNQLRPETLESLYILYSVTKDERYRDYGWKIFQSMNQYCRTDVAFSGIKDVRDVPPEMNNAMESYVLAETFKYLILLFDDHLAQVLSLDHFVFNTEAHPLKIFDYTREFPKSKQ